MHEALKKFDAGVHLKTAGTTWLEELIGLAMAGGDGLEIAKDVYRGAWGRFDELCAPMPRWSTSIAPRCPRRRSLPAGTARPWPPHCVTKPPARLTIRTFASSCTSATRSRPRWGGRFTAALQKHSAVIAANVTHNLYERHIRPLFLGR